MMETQNKLTASAKDSSTIIQVNNSGLSYKDVKDLCKELFKENFPKLVDEASKKASLNLENFANEFFNQINDEDISSIMIKLKDPNSQYLLYNCIKNASRQGNRIDLKLLARVLKQSLLIDEKDVNNAIIANALDFIPQLDKSQLYIIMLSVFMTRLHFFIETPDNLEKVASLIFTDFINEREIKSIQLKHLVTLGIFSYNSIITNKGEDILKDTYSDIQFFDDYISKQEHATVDFIINDYNRYDLGKYECMPVGILIGLLICKEKFPHVDVIKFMNEEIK